jgi:hypothetical protein
VNEFIEHLYARLVNRSNYSATANLHNAQITTAPAKPFPLSCSLATASTTVEILQLYPLTPFSTGHHLTNKLSSKLLSMTTLRHGSRRKHSSSIGVQACSSRRCLPTVAARTTKNTYLLLLRALPSNGRSLQSHRIATAIRARYSINSPEGTLLTNPLPSVAR